MKVELATHAGYCYGVERALTLTEDAKDTRRGPIFTLGPIIHNHQVVAELESNGIYALDEIGKAQGGTVILRTHGVEPNVVTDAARLGVEVVDATCPFVKKAQAKAAELSEEGYQVIILGEQEHPEVRSHLAYAGRDAIVVESDADFARVPRGRRVGIVVQTTQSIEKLRSLVDYCTRFSSELKVHNTICRATYQMQDAASELAGRADAMVVVGGYNSANTSRLAKMCQQINARTFHVETEDDIRLEWFSKSDRLVGVAGGASTPAWILEKVIDRLEHSVSERRPSY